MSKNPSEILKINLDKNMFQYFDFSSDFLCFLVYNFSGWKLKMKMKL